MNGTTTTFEPHECAQAVARLTDRQKEILRLIAAGKPQKEIASELGISIGTVINHSSAMYQILRVQNNVLAVRVAIAGGLVSVTS